MIPYSSFPTFDIGTYMCIGYGTVEFGQNQYRLLKRLH